MHVWFVPPIPSGHPTSKYNVIGWNRCGSIADLCYDFKHISVVLYAHEGGKWNDVPCNYNLPYVCKKGTVLCGAPPTVDSAFLVGRKRSHYDIHSVVRYQCADGFLQRHVPTAKCRANGKWDRPKIICTKSRRSHRNRRHHHNGRRERRKHKKHGHREGGHHGGRDHNLGQDHVHF